MANECPNCGSGEQTRCILFGDYRCNVCGTTWKFSERGIECIDVPTRSRPAEVLELPDVDAFWWYRAEAWQNWSTGRFSPTNNRGRGHYVRCVEPIIPPPQPEPDADAEKLRLWAHWIGPGSKYNGLTQDDLRRIAADLERLKREAKEAGR